jgi:hypothetical protein
MFRNKKKNDDNLVNPFVGGAAEAVNPDAVVNEPVVSENMSEDDVEAAIKEAEASTGLSGNNSADAGGDYVAMTNPEPTPIAVNEATDRHKEAKKMDITTATPAPVAPSAPVRPAPAESTQQPNIEVDLVSTGNEFDDLVAWVERDTANKVDKIQKIINELDSRISNINAEIEHDTAGLSADAKTLFEKNTRKNIGLIEDQIDRERARQVGLKKKSNIFVNKVQAALKEYNEIPVVEEYKDGKSDKFGKDTSFIKDATTDL